jgi:putative endonuclease
VFGGIHGIAIKPDPTFSTLRQSVIQPKDAPPAPLVIPAEAGIHGLDFSPGVKCGYLYIMASSANGTLYTGVTSNIARRVFEHREDMLDGFTKKYNVHRLVYFERYESVVKAIEREKRVKKWKRAWKIRLIEAHNPHWRDLYGDLVGTQ